MGVAFMVVLRLIQGLALGSDLASPTAYLSDHAPRKPCLHASIIPATCTLGALAAGAVCLFVSWILEGRSLGAWGWRVPLVFCLGVGAGQVGLRLGVLRDPEEAMSMAEVADRREEHVGRVVRWVKTRGRGRAWLCRGAGVKAVVW